MAQSLSTRDKSSLLRGLVGSAYGRVRACKNASLPVPANVAANPKFMTAAEAVMLIPDEAVVFLTGFGVHNQTLALHSALARRFEDTQSPRNLTLMVGATAGAGPDPKTPLVNPDSLYCSPTCLPAGKDEQGKDKVRLVGRFVIVHVGSWPVFRGNAALAAGEVETHIIPLGVMCLSLRNMAERGTSEVVLLDAKSPAGTDFDPRCGKGTPLFVERGDKQMVQVDDAGNFTYSLPLVEVVFVAAAACDAEGNIYFKGDPCLANRQDAVGAAKAQGGLVLVQVGMVVQAGYGPIDIPADMVDAIVVRPYHEQTLFRLASNPFHFLSPIAPITARHGHPVHNIERGLAKLAWLQSLLGVLKARSPLEKTAARVVSWLLSKELWPGATIDIGVGLPEEAALAMHRAGILAQLEPIVESGAVGGMPATGAFFGVSVCPTSLIRSSQVFENIYKDNGLGCIIVGALEADSAGNVNVSQKGPTLPVDYVGPGGFVDFTITARVVVFICPWKLKTGKGKFVKQVYSTTFNGQQSLKRGQRVFYVSECCVFMLTQEGMTLRYLVPGTTLDNIVSSAEETGFDFIVPSAPITLDLKADAQLQLLGEGRVMQPNL